MAKIEGMPVPQKAPSLSGNLVVSTWRGIAYVAKWPRKRTRPLPLHTQEQSEWFRQAGVLAKWLAPQQMKAAIEATKGTPLYPRDVLVMGMAGTLLSITMEDGRTLYSMSAREGVSGSLDILSQQDGAILARSNGLWVPVYTPDVGKVLTSKGPDTAPDWETPGGGGGGRWELIAEKDAPVSGLMEFTGIDFSSYKRVQIYLNDLKNDTNDVYVGFEYRLGAAWITAGYGVGGRWVNDFVSASSFQSFNGPRGYLSFFTANGRLTLTANQTFNATLDLNAIGTTAFKIIQGRSAYMTTASQYFQTWFGINLKNAGLMTGFRVYPSAGTWTSGSISVWGLL